MQITRRQPIPIPEPILIQLSVEEATLLRKMACLDCTIPQLFDKTEGAKYKEFQTFLRTMYRSLEEIGISL